MASKGARLSLLSLGLAFGITWGLCLLFLGILAWLWDWGMLFVHVIGTVYIGYAPTPLGSVIGLVWGFIDAFIAGVIIAFLYNYFSKKCE